MDTLSISFIKLNYRFKIDAKGEISEIEFLETNCDTCDSKGIKN